MIARNIKKFTLILSSFMMVLPFLIQAPAHAASFNANYIMPDSSFNDSGSMSAASIDSWLNSKYGSGSCISTMHGFKAPEPIGFTPTSGFTYGGDATAGTIIYDAAHVYGLNPRVLLSTLEKEENLVTGGSGCSTLRYTSALGYGCPDSQTLHNYSGFELYSINGAKVTSVTGTCVTSSKYAGFARQIIYATWTLKYAQQHAIGNPNWDAQASNFPHSGNTWDNSDDPKSCYNSLVPPGYMTPGNRAEGGTGSGCTTVISFSGKYTIDSTSVTMLTGATAALYEYTPHISGNTSFFNLFVQWFGNPNEPCYATTNNSSSSSGGQIIASQFYSSGAANLTFTRLNNTGSACVEAHVMGPNYNSWLGHYATALKSVDPSLGKMLPANIYNNSSDELVFVKYAGAQSSICNPHSISPAPACVELHVLSPNYQGWNIHLITALSSLDPSRGEVIAADINGDGHDEIIYVRYVGATSSVCNPHKISPAPTCVELHVLSSDFQHWVSHIITAIPTFDPTNGEVIAGDFNGRGRDQLMYVRYGGASSSICNPSSLSPAPTCVEIHTLNNSFQGWVGHTVTALAKTDISPNKGEVIAADINGDGRDELMFIRYKGAVCNQANGYPCVEVHTFYSGSLTWYALGQLSWASHGHIVTDLSLPISFDFLSPYQ